MGRRGWRARWSTRLRVVVVLWLVASSAVAGVAGAGRFPLRVTGAGALNGNSGGGVAPAIVPRRLVVARLETLPAPPIALDVRRVVVAPSGVLRPVAAGGPIAVFVDAGAATAEVAGKAIFSRVTVPVAREWPDPVPVDGTVDLRCGDHLTVPADAAVRLANALNVPAVLVIARAVPAAARIWPFAAAEGDAAVAWEVLAESLVADVPTPPVYLLVTRVVYAAGASDPVPTENGGPLSIAVEAGTAGYLLTAGNSALVLAGQGTSRQVEPGEEVILPVGAYAVEEWGAVSRLRNAATDRAWVLVTTLVSVNPPENE